MWLPRRSVTTIGLALCNPLWLSLLAVTTESNTAGASPCFECVSERRNSATVLRMLLRRRSGRQLVAVAVVSWFTSGCCTSLGRARAIDEEMRQENLARAEPAILRAAQRRGATLLPDRPLELGFTPFCGAAPDIGPRRDGYCVLQSGTPISMSGEFADVYQLLDRQGKQHLAITLGESHNGARLARRGKTLFVLTLSATFHNVGERSRCECEGGPRIISMSDSVNIGSAFLLDDLAPAEIQQIVVPVVDDYIEWKCKTILVQNDHFPHLGLACQWWRTSRGRCGAANRAC